MNFNIGNKNITNPFAKILFSIFAVIIVVLVLGLIVGILSSVAVFVLIVLFFVALIVPIATVFGYGKWMKGIRGSGEFLTEIREVKEYKSIKISIPCNFEIINNSTREIEITSDDNLLGYILTYVQDDCLYITSDNNLSPKKPIILKVQSDYYESLNISGTAKGSINQVKQDKLDVNISGAANVSGNGKVENITINISGVGKVFFKELKTENAILKVSGTAKADLYVTKSLKATINGTGKADIYGKPESVDKKINGVGKINII